MITKALAVLVAGMAVAVMLEVVFGVHVGLVRWLHQDLSNLAWRLAPWH